MAKASPKLVGAFVLVAIALLVSSIVVFASGQLFSKTHDFILFFDGNVAGLRVGAPVKFRGVEIGAVRDVRIDIANVSTRDRTADGTGPGIPVIFFIDEKRLTQRGATAVMISNPDSIERLIDLGFRAELKVESFVTGRRYIELDIYTDAEDNRLNDPLVPYQEIPTVVTGLNLTAIQDDVTRVLREIGDLKLASTLQAIQETFDSLTAVVASPGLRTALNDLPEVVVRMDSTLAAFTRLAQDLDTTMVPVQHALLATSDQVQETLRAAEASFGTVRDLVDPESPLAVQLSLLMRDLAASARATTALTEYLQRNPSSILRGKPEEK
jgi:paraquat-inducible protein B